MKNATGKALYEVANATEAMTHHMMHTLASLVAGHIIDLRMRMKEIATFQHNLHAAKGQLQDALELEEFTDTCKDCGGLSGPEHNCPQKRLF